MTPIIVAGILILSAITVAFVLYPVVRASALARRYITDSVAGDRLAELIAQRDAVYDAIRDVDFDRETGKLTSEDHRLMRERLTAEGVRLLQELDRLMQSNVREDIEREIEREVAALRQTAPAEAGEEQLTPRPRPKPERVPTAERSDREVSICPTCGEAIRASAQFCTHCGASLILTCPQCGVTVAPDDRFCRSCGAHLSQASAEAAAVMAEAVD
ncbi:MAG: zinc ribbon domain-containing protein [Anaerolineae bacterium]